MLMLWRTQSSHVRVHRWCKDGVGMEEAVHLSATALVQLLGSHPYGDPGQAGHGLSYSTDVHFY